jgi:hypothetical protein
MAELTFKSAGVGLREIDLSGQTQPTPVGTPAGVIGTANRGPAFVPVVVANYQQFSNKFGPSDGEKFGPIAMYEWLKNSQAGVYLRVLGAGDGKTRTISGDNTGKVTNAGFVVGNQIVQAAGDIGANPYAFGSYSGRTHFLGCFMSESAGSTIFSEAGLQTGASAVPVIRGVLMTPNGVIASLSGSSQYSNDLPLVTAPTTTIGFATGTVNTTAGANSFTLFLSGHKSSDAYKNGITASFNPTSPSYFANVFNTDPTKIEEAGHYLYAHYEVYDQYATVTGSGQNLGKWPANSAYQDVAFVLVGSQNQNVGTTTVPNYENFEDRFATAYSPYVTSQKFGGTAYDLFRVYSLDDGAYANSKVKISIRNITPSTDPTSLYGTFDLFVRDFSDTDENPIVLESFVGLSLNPNNEKYIAKAIGDLNTYFEFDREAGSQKLVVDGLYPNVSNYIRVDVTDVVQNVEVPGDALPFGFRGPNYVVTSGKLANAGANTPNTAKQPPIPFRKALNAGTGNSLRVLPYAHWGVQFEVNDSLTEPNKNTYADGTVESHTKYFPSFHTTYLNVVGSGSDADAFNNNKFSLEQVQVYTTSDDLPDSKRWAEASYRRAPGASAAASTRYLKPSDLADAVTRRYGKFSFFLQGGFDGVNIFDPDKAELTNNAAKREMDYTTTQFGPLGPTVATYRKAVDILGEKADVDIQLLAIPGIREPGVTDYAIDAVENRFDAFYLMDIPERNTADTVITGSGDTVSVNLTTNALSNRSLDTSFAAAYYPDIVIVDPTTQTNVVAPPSVAVIGAFSLNDKVAYPWFAPAGFSRGALSDVVETQVKLNRTNLDTLYSANINPITTVQGTNTPIVFGQKTLLARSSALDRVNVRRLLIEIRRRVRAVANTILFEPNRESTLARFTALVDPILKQIQSQQGVDRYKVKIDTTTTTQADVENNTIRGKIFIQPTKSIEFVSLDFVVTNAGAQI